MSAILNGGTVTTRMRTDVPDPEEAFLALVRSTEGTGCPVHAVGVLASHLSGPVSAQPPDWHPRQRTQSIASRRSLDALIECATGLPSAQDTACSCVEGSHMSPLWVIVPNIAAETCIARPPRFTDEVLTAIYSGDVDAGVPVLDGRLDALLVLADHTRAVQGGELDHETEAAARTLAETLVGRTRWWQIGPYESAYNWPVSWRYGAAAIKANSFLSNDGIGKRIVARVADGH